MNKPIKALTFLCAIMMLLAGCKSSPEKKVVSGKDALSNEGASPVFPSEWKHSISNENLTVNIDSKLDVPQNKSVIEFNVEPHKFTDKQLQEIINNFFPDCYFEDSEQRYDQNRNEIKTKSEIEQLILETQKDINDLKAGDYPNAPEATEDKNTLLQTWETMLVELKQKYQSAPEEIEFAKINSISQDMINEGLVYTVRDNNSSKLIGLLGVNGNSVEDGKVAGFSITINQKKDFKETDKELYNETPLQMSREDAIKIADDVINNKLNAKDMHLNYITVGQDSFEHYKIIYTKKYNDLAENYSEEYRVFEAPEHYSMSWPTEYIEVDVTQDGAFYINWIHTTKKTENTEVEKELLSFEKIKQRFEEQVKLTQAWVDKSIGMKSKEVVIDDIRLGMMKVKQKDSNEYKMVPVWDFFGYSIESFDKQPEGYYQLDSNNQYVNKTVCSYMTINAIDGTVIDRMLGY